MDFFFNSYDSNENQKLLETLCMKAKKVEEIHPMDIVIDKTIRGDLGDNILPVVYKKAKNPNSDKIFRVSNKELDLSIDITNVDEVKAYFEDLLNKKTWKDKAMSTLDEIIEHFFYNDLCLRGDPDGGRLPLRPPDPDPLRRFR